MTLRYEEVRVVQFQSLFYWITYSYILIFINFWMGEISFNPYFIGLPILIRLFLINPEEKSSFNPYFIGLPILMSER